MTSRPVSYLLIYCRKYLLLGLCLFSSITLAANNISELVLPNGLKIVVKPDNRSPIAVFQIWYKVGSSYEQKGITGISHMLEHLMYRGAKTHSLSVGFSQMNNIGALGNAYTSRDHTFYYHILGKKHLPLAFALEAQRMQDLSPDINDFYTEKKVIQEERHSLIGRDPYLPANNTLHTLAFKQDSYQFPVLGRAEDLHALTLAQTMSWYKKYYTPGNASIVVVGDVDSSAVFDLARKFFTPIRKTAQLSSNRSITIEQQTSASHKVMPETTKVGALLLAFKVPSIKTARPSWEAYALEVLAGWFESGTNSRLTKALLRDKQLAHEITIMYSSMTRKDSLFIIEAIPAQNISLTQLEQALNEELKQIKNELISQAILEKIKNQMLAAEIFDRDSIYTQAKIIGQAESVGIHWSEDAQYMTRIQAVTAEQVQKVFHKYFIPENKFVVFQNSHNPDYE